MRFKERLWRVRLVHKMDYEAPSFWVETFSPINTTREGAEVEALRLAKEKTRLADFPKSWTIIVTHLENYKFIDGRWVKNRCF